MSGTRTEKRETPRETAERLFSDVAPFASVSDVEFRTRFINGVSRALAAAHEKALERAQRKCAELEQAELDQYQSTHRQIHNERADAFAHAAEAMDSLRKEG